MQVTIKILMQYFMMRTTYTMKYSKRLKKHEVGKMRSTNDQRSTQPHQRQPHSQYWKKWDFMSSTRYPVNTTWYSPPNSQRRTACNFSPGPNLDFRIKRSRSWLLKRAFFYLVVPFLLSMAQATYISILPLANLKNIFLFAAGGAALNVQHRDAADHVVCDFSKWI